MSFIATCVDAIGMVFWDRPQPTKSNLVPVTLMNTNDYNVWIRQPLFAGELYEVD